MTLVSNPLFARYFNRFAARREDRGNRCLPASASRYVDR